jgi:hypothetical protein
MRNVAFKLKKEVFLQSSVYPSKKDIEISCLDELDVLSGVLEAFSGALAV